MPFVHNQTYIQPYIPTNISVSVNNGPSFSTTAKVGTYSALFNASNQFVIYTNSIPYNLGDQYTIEWWWRPTGALPFTDTQALTFGSGAAALNVSMNNTIVPGPPPDSQSPVITVNGLSYSAGVVFQVNVGTWANIACVKASANVMRIYINGTLYTTLNGPIGNPLPGSTVLTLGSGINANPSNLDQLRISTVARYNSNYTPQSTPYTYDQSTYMILGFENTWAPTSPV
jgi:hypothetical protein